MAFDPDFDKVSLLLHGDGSFADNSPTPKTLTVANGTPTFSTSIKKFGSAAMDFSRTGAMTIPSGMDFGTGDFTVETWIYWVTAVGTEEWGAFQLSTPSSYVQNQQNIVVLCGAGNVYAFYTGHGYSQSSKVITTGTWQQLEINRSGGRLRAFVEGVQILDVDNTFNFANPSGVIGGYYNSNFNGNVLLDDFRVTKGVARHTANFTPPTEPFPDTASAPALSAYASAPTPLGAPAILAASVRQAWASSLSPLGAPATLAANGDNFFVRAAAATPLGAPLALARAVGAARVATAGPLGAGAALGQLVAVARAAASGPLGAPVVMARTTVYAQASAPSPLGDPVVKANLPSALLQAHGFNSTAFGTPSFATRLQAAGLNSTAFGVPSSPVPQTVVASGFSKTSFGWPFGFQYTQPKVDQVVSASPLATTQFGLPSAFIDVTVQAAGSTSGQFGTPTTKLGLGAQAIAPATSWGAPLLLLSMRAQGFGSTSFGVPHAAMVLHAASTYRATRWGLPTCTRSNTYPARSIASTPRFGRPTACKINAYQASSMAPSGQFGTPACALRYRALGIHGVARFGKPLLRRSTVC